MKIVFPGDSVTEGSFGFYWDENGDLCGRKVKDACYVRQTELPANHINHPTPGMHGLFVDVLTPTLTALCQTRFSEGTTA